MIYVNGRAINTTMFSDNTSQVWKLPLDTYTHHVSIVWKYSYESEVMQLAQLKALLDTKGLTTDLDIDYLPYARQDKNISNDTTFALTVFAKFINDMKFDKIAIHDPHSRKALALINNSYDYYPHKQLAWAFKETNSDILCYPDNGAFVKYLDHYDYPYAWAEKERDQATGEILSSTLMNANKLKGKNILIVDDICDGGRTFILLAQQLTEAGVGRINLFVTHGIFSKGLRVIKDAGIMNIYTAKGRAYMAQDQLQFSPMETK